MAQPSVETVDLSKQTHWDSPFLPGRSQTSLYIDLACFSTLSSSGIAQQTPVRCRKRPDRRHCKGLLRVRRRDIPEPTVEWTCPNCGTAGKITGWEDGPADLRHLKNANPPANTQLVTISIVEHAALCDFARGDTDWAATVYGTTVKNDRIAIPVSMSDRENLARSLVLAAHQIPGSAQSKRLEEVARAVDPITADLSARELCGSSSTFSPNELAQNLDLDAAIEAVIAGDTLPFALTEPPASRIRPKRQTNNQAQTAGTHTIKITLRHVKPPVWRRLVVPSEIELPQLHDVIQAAMGWLDCHLHAFSVGRQQFSPHEDDFEPIGEDSRGVTLRDLAPSKGNRFDYEYDFGDGWIHQVLVEKATIERCPTIQCVAGRRACPPEDCGGPWGYANLLEILANPNHPEHEEFAEMHGEHVQPERFEMEQINSILRGTP